MGAHVVIMGGSPSGKTTLMLALAGLETGPYHVTIERHLTDRHERPGEGARELRFVQPETFDALRGEFLLWFRGYGDYRYGVLPPSPLDEWELRPRVLSTSLAMRFAEVVQEPTILCAVTPVGGGPGAYTLYARDPSIAYEDVEARLVDFAHEDQLARQIADIHYMNRYDLGRELAATAFRDLVLAYAIDHNL